MTQKRSGSGDRQKREGGGHKRSGERSQRPRRRRRPPSKSKEATKDVNKEATKETVKNPVKSRIPKRYGVVFYSTLQAAKDDGPQLLERAKEVDQLNIVIRAEAPMDDPELLQYGKIYAGEAWALIHDRRVEEGWYETPH